ncbi:hypothetical protein HYO14_22470 [Vibrio parahaemolyticus]|uniref:hypothetical protein n=1 Tax=Vibrio parahaemolyticus TaxID=670 RepID=UPI000A90DA0F|nr:hypothetical protein [Vibrio parahaemolyticus]EGR2264749.1 hypothetical protein [Vibrio parahaemolyticus]EGR3255047.1 hypothetical protein [Vibrio parahaemolyticus]EHK2856223.1 hypothetical protein [Vibrio parahaemolyticus]EIU6776430.1 hypothetical protein [Vibrio parahaemolyticus]EJC6780163.1 hypothetical protein [Vibrio parahaemolyticus]
MKIELWFPVWFGFSVSEADSLVESQLCDIVFSNERFGVVRLYSTALFVPSGFSDRCFETAPDLSFSTYVKLVLAKLHLTSNQSFRLGN